MQTTTPEHALENWEFDNKFTSELPGDPLPDNNRRQVRQACFSRVDPTPVPSPTLTAFSREAAALLDLTEQDCRSPLFTEIFSGNRLLSDMKPYAMNYGGHQFGSWAGQLGDGRAINLGEIINRNGERWILQLKGAGPTPYSRSADGLAVLRSSLREFICSEAVHHLGIPTTRALSLVLTGEQVVRDMFYDGNPKHEPGAIVCRLSPSFIRFGNFEILTSRKEHDLLERLVDYTIQTDYPHLATIQQAKDRVLQWYAEVCEKTARMISHWMRVGFVHGVMNTDNMSILGLTIDYGPYGWLEGYDPAWTPNTTDAHGRRYCYANQPYMAQWNLTQLANTLFPLVGEAPPLQEALDTYRVTFQQSWQRTMAAKVGLFTPAPGDDELINDLLDLLRATETDYTIFFRNLARLKPSYAEKQNLDLLDSAYYQPHEITGELQARLNSWLRAYVARLNESPEDDRERSSRMNRVNPKYVFRNYLAQLAIDKAEQGDFSMIDELLELLKHPYDEQPGKEEFAAKRPEWARNRPGCSMLSCSS